MDRIRNLTLIFLAFVGVIVVGTVAYQHYSVSKASVVDDSCDMPSMHPVEKTATKATSAVATRTIQQDLVQQAPPEGDVRCERPNPNGSNPDKGGQDPKKVGCKCMRKCVNGKPNENFDSPETRCKVHCKPDHCDCPDPCKS